ncbi:MAG TPA: PilT/PilU family type 4a pilus ATPase [Gemmatimonadaceae bacterium]|nr:PilT/PilU family type 4a pilus ATPase [Gemmatimonadaceae bacterium]
MPQLDRLLSAVISNKADALTLDEGDPAKLEVQGAARAVTKSPLTAQQVIGLLKEIAPPEAGRQLDTTRSATFTYTFGEGAFAVRAAHDGGKWRARITPGSGVPSAEAGNGFDPLAGLQGTVSMFTPAEASPRVASRPTPAAARPAAVVMPTPIAGLPNVARPTAPPMATVPTPARSAPPPSAPGAATNGSGNSLDHVHDFEGSEEARATIETLLRTTVERGASDLHLRCGEPPIIRLHGEMHRLEGWDALENAHLDTMLRSIMPERNRIEFGDTNDTDYAHEIAGCARFRANALRDRMGVAAVFRQIPSQVVNVEQMQISPEVQQLCYLTKGLVLVTGPTGSGKSTTLCALIDMVNRVRNDHVITIEDPIEFVHPNKNCIITQRQVGVHTKSFKSALRAALREDPDIVLVGELRDLETVSIAIETAETGHLVFGTLHTTTAPGTIDRIIDQFPADRQEQIRIMLSDSLKGVISQTLCKKIGGGRVAAREILLSIPAVANLIREAKTFQIHSIMQTSRRLGMVTLNDALIEHVDGGRVEPKEAYMKAVDKLNFMAMLKQRGLDVSFAELDLGSQGQGKGNETPASKPAVKAAAKR